MMQRLYGFMHLIVVLCVDEEEPSHAALSERAALACCILACFDAVTRCPSTTTELAVTRQMREDGGYVMDTFLKMGWRPQEVPLRESSATWEIASENLRVAFAGCIEYFDAMEDLCGHRLLGMKRSGAPEGTHGVFENAALEVQRFHPTITYLRRMLKRLKIDVYVSPGMEKQDMVAMSRWLLDNGKDKHSLYKELSLVPGWLCMRDMAALWRHLVSFHSTYQEQSDMDGLEDCEVIMEMCNERRTCGLEFELLGPRGAGGNTMDFRIRLFGGFLTFAPSTYTEDAELGAAGVAAEALRVKLRAERTDEKLREGFYLAYYVIEIWKWDAMRFAARWWRAEQKEAYRIMEIERRRRKAVLIWQLMLARWSTKALRSIVTRWALMARRAKRSDAMRWSLGRLP